MADVMVDTSVWVEYFRHGKGAVFDLVDELLDGNRVAICGMVELELLQGVRHRERKMLNELIGALSYIETERGDFQAAGHRLSELRRKGITIPASDCLTGMICHRRGLSLLAIDRHFDHLDEVDRIKIQK